MNDSLLQGSRKSFVTSRFHGSDQIKWLNSSLNKGERKVQFQFDKYIPLTCLRVLKLRPVSTKDLRRSESGQP